MNLLIRWSLHNAALVLAAALLLVGLGVSVTATMPVDVFPDLTAPTVVVLTEAHGMAPTEVESQLTFPIEAALNGAAGVRRVRSSTTVGFSIVWVEFDWDTDIYIARQVVNEKLALVTAGLPPEVHRPILAPMSSIMGEILFISLTSDRHSALELRTAAETIIRPRLLAVGVAQVTPIGGDKKQYQAVLSPERLWAYGISLQQVSEALASANNNVSAGFMTEGGSDYLTLGIGRVRGIADIADTVVTAVDGIPVRISDLGHVQIGAAPKRGEASANGQRAVILGIHKQPEANTLALTKEIDTVLDQVQARLPEGMVIDKGVFRQADFIEVAVRNVSHALRDGALLVVVVVFLFLANLRATLITLTAIPLSLLTSVLALQACGAGINTMTLGGMTIAIGALVDDAIIDVENVFRRLRENARLSPDQRRHPFQVVYDASVEIRSSIVFATFIIVLVFLPLFFLPGVGGRLLQPLGLAYVVALLASLVVALTVTPVLSYLLLPGSKGIRESHEPTLARILKQGYEKVLAPVLRHSTVVMLLSGALLIAAIVASTFLGHSFLPQFNEGALTISAVTLPGTSLAESDSLGAIAEKTILSHPEVRSVARRTGRAELDEHSQGVESSEIEVSFELGEKNKEQFLQALRDDLAFIPGMEITIGQPISHRIDHMLSGTRASVAVKIFGEDLYTLRALAAKAEDAMSRIEGVVDLSIEQQRDIPILKVRLDRKEIARYGIKIEDITRTIQAALEGVTVSQVQEGRFSFNLVVRIAEEEGWNLRSIGDLPLDTPDGAKIPLKAVAKISKEAGPNTISRENVQRKIVVMCNVFKRDVASVVRDVKAVVDPMVPAIPGYWVEYGGQFEAGAAASRILMVLGVAVILGIGFLLQLAFRSARDAMLIMVNLPLALIGGVAGVFISGGVLSVASLIGLITVFGIATRNGIMLVSHIRHLHEREGITDLREAVFRGSVERLVPIFMTALATALALVPLVIGANKAGNEIQTPMAIVILCGLTTSMLLNMIVVPALYVRFGKAVTASGDAQQGGHR